MDGGMCQGFSPNLTKALSHGPLLNSFWGVLYSSWNMMTEIQNPCSQETHFGGIQALKFPKDAGSSFLKCHFELEVTSPFPVGEPLL